LKILIINVIIGREINMTIKSVNSEKILRGKKNGWKASKIVRKLGVLCRKDLRWILNTHKRLE
jgi:hypothetical protein